MTVAGRPTRRRWAVGIGLIAGLTACGAAWVLLSRHEARVFRDGMARARVELESGYPATAVERLRALAARYPREPEVSFRLGVCEQALGRTAAALAAWEQVPEGSEWYPKAAEVRATALTNTGRYRPAEDVIERALPRARVPADALRLRRVLSRLYRFEGRVDDVRRVLQQS